MQFWLKTKTGPVEVRRDKIEQLRQAGKLSDTVRVISTDGGKTWLTYPNAFSQPQDATGPTLASLPSNDDAGNGNRPVSSADDDGHATSAYSYQNPRLVTPKKKCTKCGQQFTSTDRLCPHCNTKQPLMPRWLAIGISVTSIAILLSLGMHLDANSSSSRPASGGYSSSSGRQWYQGGTLHAATVSQWRRATARNKLATAGDWLTGTLWEGHLHTAADFNRLRGKARMLVIAIDTAIEANEAYDVAISEVGQIVPVLLVMMEADLAP